MEHVNKGVTVTKNCPTFHIVFYLHTLSEFVEKPTCSSVNIDAKNAVDALELFIKMHPDKLDDIIYITNLENCKL